MTRKFNLSLVIAPLALAALAACSPRDDDRTAGQKLDSAIAQTEQKADAAKAEMSQAAESAKAEMGQAADNAKAGMESMADKAATGISDATITASVNAELAKDPQLSAIKINVDTDSGRVTLKGTAPNTAAADRATTLAASVKGVTKVDNQLTVTGG